MSFNAMRFIQVGGPTSHECMHEKCHMILTNGKWKFRFVVTTIIGIIIFSIRFVGHPGDNNFPDDDMRITYNTHDKAEL